MGLTLLKLLLLLQGFYYGLTGLWALIALDHFMTFTRHKGDAFDMMSIAALAFVVGLVFIAASRRPADNALVVWLLFGSAAAVVVPELLFLAEIIDTLFFYDLFEEAGVALLTFPFLLKSPHHPERQ